MTPLRIALVAHPRHPIAEPFKGGMELIVFISPKADRTGA